MLRLRDTFERPYSRAHVRSRDIFFLFFFFSLKRNPLIDSLITTNLFLPVTQSDVRKVYRIYIYIFYTHVYVYTIHMYLRTYDQLRVDRRNRVFCGSNPIDRPRSRIARRRQNRLGYLFESLPISNSMLRVCMFICMYVGVNYV